MRNKARGFKFLLFAWGLYLLAGMPALGILGCERSMASRQQEPIMETKVDTSVLVNTDTSPPGIDTLLYLKRLQHLAQHGVSTSWPVKTGYPIEGAILPFYRIVAYYGNLYSKRMGVLGRLPEEIMLDSLQQEVRRWELADSTTKVKPALHYIAVTAQRDPGKDKKYRQRMPEKELSKVLELAKKINALVFLDIQVGHSTLQEEIPRLREYLSLPQVHLGIDPEYSMKGGDVPGKRVGTMDASDINYASAYLEELVKELKIPPKILVIHRFKKTMVTNYQEILTRPEVQIVMHMDGFGSRGKKLTTYNNTITAEPVQFAGFKLFYKNDKADPAKPFIMHPEEVLKLYPIPIYIQYQ